MKKLLVGALVISSILTALSFYSYGENLIENMSLASYFSWSGGLLVVLALFSYCNSVDMPTGDSFESEYYVQHDLNTYKAQEKNMIRDFENWSFSSRNKFVVLMVSSSVPLFFMHLILK